MLRRHPPSPLLLTVSIVALIAAGCADRLSDTQSTDTDSTPRPGTSSAPTTTFEADVAGVQASDPRAQFPSDAGLVNVRDYGALGDGRTDDTEALRRAIEDNVGKNRTLFFPAGTYIVSDSLEWRDAEGEWQPYLTLQGEGREHTIISLKDAAAGFGDPDEPRAVIVTASGLFGGSANAGGKDYRGLGEGNEAFRNYLFDLTVETGRGNAGAIGVDFLANNNGGLVNVTIRASDGDGVAGLSMMRKWPGPAFFKNVRIEGFDYGVMTQWTEYGLTFENLHLEDQQIAGIQNDGNVLSILGLTSENAVPAIRNVSSTGLLVLIDGDLRGGSRAASAIDNAGELYARSVTTAGYHSAVDGVEGTTIDELAEPTLIGRTPSPPTSLLLPIERTPSLAVDDPADWASVSDPAHAGGADPRDDRDDTAAIQAALDSGKSTIYFPSSGPLWEGRYLVSDTLTVPATVHRIIGLESAIGPAPGHRFNDADSPVAVFRILGGVGGQVVSIERLRLGGFGVESPGAVWFDHVDPRTLVLQHIQVGGGHRNGSYRGTQESGSLFLEDYCCAALTLAPGQHVFARQLNLESPDLKLDNQGARLWVLGIKTEQPSTVIRTAAGGETELLGGLLYPVDLVPSDVPAFVAEDGARFSLIYAVSAYAANRNYTVQVRETHNGQTHELLSDQVPARRLGSAIPLYRGFS